MVFSECIAIYMAFTLHQSSGSDRDKNYGTTRGGNLYYMLQTVVCMKHRIDFFPSFSSSRCTVYTVRSIFSVETGFRLSDDQ